LKIDVNTYLLIHRKKIIFQKKQCMKLILNLHIHSGTTPSPPSIPWLVLPSSSFIARKPGAKKEDASDDEAKVKVKEDQGDETDESDGDDERKNAHADLEDMVRKVRFNLETLASH